VLQVVSNAVLPHTDLYYHLALICYEIGLVDKLNPIQYFNKTFEHLDKALSTCMATPSSGLSSRPISLILSPRTATAGAADGEVGREGVSIQEQWETKIKILKLWTQFAVAKHKFQDDHVESFSKLWLQHPEEMKISFDELCQMIVLRKDIFEIEQLFKKIDLLKKGTHTQCPTSHPFVLFLTRRGRDFGSKNTRF
jgi:hypothetical protein